MKTPCADVGDAGRVRERVAASASRTRGSPHSGANPKGFQFSLVPLDQIANFARPSEAKAIGDIQIAGPRHAFKFGQAHIGHERIGFHFTIHVFSTPWSHLQRNAAVACGAAKSAATKSAPQPPNPVPERRAATLLPRKNETAAESPGGRSRFNLAPNWR
jgi:hypothetical protein